MPRLYRFRVDTRSPSNRVEGEPVDTFSVEVLGLVDKREPEHEQVTAIFTVITPSFATALPYQQSEGPSCVVAIGAAVHEARALGFAFTERTIVGIERLS